MHSSITGIMLMKKQDKKGIRLLEAKFNQCLRAGFNELNSFAEKSN